MADPPKKRVQLTVLQQTDPDHAADVGEGRSPGSWVVLGAMAIWTAFAILASVLVVPFRALAMPSDGRLTERSFNAIAVGAVLTLAIASALGGYLVGRWGGRASAKEAGISGAIAGSVLWLITIKGMPVVVAGAGGLAIMFVTTACAFRGGRAGVRGRKPGDA